MYGDWLLLYTQHSLLTQPGLKQISVSVLHICMYIICVSGLYEDISQSPNIARQLKKQNNSSWASEASLTLGCSIEISRDIYVTVPGKRDQFGNFFKIKLLLPQGRVGFELQNALHI